MKNYLARIQHDKGIVRIKTRATSKTVAKKMIMIAERCPESAIISIREHINFNLK